MVVAVSAPHRGEAFAGAREIIDAIKATAPIWKTEEGDAARWVTGTPPAPPAAPAAPPPPGPPVPPRSS